MMDNYAIREMSGGKSRNYWRIWWRNLHIEIGLWKDARHTMLQFEQTLDGDDQRQISIGITHLFNVWIGWRGIEWDFQKVRLEGLNRSIGVRIFSGGIWFDFWGDNTGYGPRRQWSLFPLETALKLLFGKQKYSLMEHDSRQLYLALPEGYVPATVKRELQTWKRPRSPFKKQNWIVEVTPVVPVPIPGKGEESWDLDDDGIVSSSFATHEYYDATRQFVERVVDKRLKYGGYSWRPDYGDFKPLTEAEYRELDN